MLTTRHSVTNRLKDRGVISNIISSLLILLFLYAGISKLLIHAAFIHTLESSPLLKNVGVTLSWIIPVSEFVISLLLFIPELRSKGLLLSTLLMACFTLYIAYMILFIPSLPCSCGGVLNKMGWKGHFIFNITFTGLAYTGWILEKKNKQVIAQ